MRILVVEDEFTSRRILQRILSAYGDCDVAVDGKEAVEVFQMALEEEKAYGLVCLDIMLPHMDGQNVLKRIRELESERGVALGHGAKIIMTTCLGDATNVMGAFRSGCEAYLIKPIDRSKVLLVLGKLGLLDKDPPAASQ